MITIENVILSFIVFRLLYLSTGLVLLEYTKYDMSTPYITIEDIFLEVLKSFILDISLTIYKVLSVIIDFILNRLILAFKEINSNKRVTKKSKRINKRKG